MEVRAAMVGDADQIAALNATGWRTGFRGLISDAYLAAYDGLPHLRHETLANPGVDDIQLVAVDGPQVVGWVSGGPAGDSDLGSGAYEVRACYVDPARWRSGIGRWAHLVLWTVRDAAPTNAFYVSLGMTRDGQETLLDRGGPVPLVRFSVRLDHIRTRCLTGHEAPRPRQAQRRQDGQTTTT